LSAVAPERRRKRNLPFTRPADVLGFAQPVISRRALIAPAGAALRADPLALPALSNPISLPYGPVDRIEFRRFRNRGALTEIGRRNQSTGRRAIRLDRRTDRHRIASSAISRG
jgi:hypothetical protein